MNRVTVSLAVCAALAATTVEARQGPGAQSPTASAADPVQTRRAVAVLPFSNISGQPGDEWIGRGIADTVVTDLQRGGAVSVIGPEVMPQMARSLGGDLSEGSERRVAELGQRIGAAWVVTGSYQRLGDRVRITARVIDVASGTVSRALKIDGTIDQLFALQDRVVAELGPDLRGLSASSALQPQSAVQSAAPQQNAAPASERPRGAGRGTGAGSPSASASPAPAGNLPFAIIGPPAPVPPAVISRDAASGRATVRAVRLTAPLRVDGKLDEAVYASVPSMSDFIQQEPQEGSAATEKTEVWLFFDRDQVYVSLRCWESHPERMVVNEMRRDNFNLIQNDGIGFIFDTFYDRRNGVVFNLNSIGGRMEGQVTNERQFNGDWNPVWDVEVGRFEGGWTIEAAIPFKSLRYRPGRAQIWGFNVWRRNRWKNESSYLMRIPNALGNRGIFQVSLAATLVGLEAPAGSRNLEVKPYAISDLTSDLTAAPKISNELGGDVGVDVKYGLTQNLTADFTYNTDFAQVEADEQQVNLTRFSLFFPEKREFFLENQGTFAFGGVVTTGAASDTPILFYSRRIGLDRGRAVPIQAGGRLTGRLGRFSLGLLNIQSDEEPISGARGTNFSVVRLKRDLLRRSSIGAIFTGRSVGERSSGTNEAYGVDGTFAFFDNLALNTYWARTRTDGVAGEDTSYRAQLEYAGDRYGVQLERLVVGDHFNPDIGFLRRDDMRKSFGQFRFSPRPRSIASVRKFSWTGSLAYIENGAGRLETREQDGEFAIELQNSDRFSVAYAGAYEFLPRPFRVASGVTLPVGGYDYASVKTGFNFGQQRAASGNLLVEYGTFYSGHKTALGVSRGRLNLTPQLSVEPTYSVNWVDLVEGSFTTHLLGARVTYTMTPLMFVSALLQYNSSSAAVSANVRLRWEYRPGSELFVVVNEQRDTLAPRFPALANRAVIVKINRLFRF